MIKSTQVEAKTGRNRFTRLGAIVNRQLPFAIIIRRNPVFERQLKRLAWPPANRLNSRFIPIAKKTILKEYTFKIGVLIPAFSGILFSLIAFGDPYWTLGAQSIVFIIIGFSLLANIYYMLGAINNIIPQLSGGQWEPLRLTELTESDILLANYATIQVRVWRIMVIDIAIRIFVGVILILYIGFELLRLYSSLRTFEILGIGIFLSTMIIVTGYIFEPLWRMRAVTLIGMTVATWVKDYGITVILSFAAILALVLLEAGVVIGIAWAAVTLMTPVFIRYSVYGNSIFGFLIFTFCSAVLVAGLYFFFRAIQAVVFTRLKRVAFRD